MKLGFFADGPWAHQALHRILSDKNFEVCFVCLRYKKPDSVLKKIAAEHGIPVLVHRDVNSDKFLITIKKYKSEIFVSMSFNQIFKQKIIKQTARGIINCHAGKLPFYRGRSVLNWALINDEKEFGITTHFVDPNIDTGDIIFQNLFSISDEDDYKTLLERAYIGCAENLYESLQKIKKGNVEPKKQNLIHPWGSYFSKRIPGDEKINWNQSSREIFNFVRALAPPGPCALTEIRSKKIKIYKTQFLSDATIYRGIPGSVLKKDDLGLLVKTKDTFLRILKWDPKIEIRVGDRMG